jgi:hypothetical protein
MSGANTWRGANTWSVALNENTGGGGGSSGVQSITAGTNITLGGTSTDPIINSTATTTGVSSLTAGTGISVSSSTGAVTVGNTGILSLTAGTGVSITSGTSPTISATGVQSVSAGTNISITGTATNPIINTPLIPTGSLLNINNADFVVPVAQLANCYLYSATALTAPRTISFPNYSSLLAQYGANAVIPFFVGNFRQPTPGEAIALAVVGDNTPSNVFFNQSVSAGAWVATAPTPSSGGFVLDYKGMWRGTCILDSTLGDAYFTFTWLTTFS